MDLWLEDLNQNNPKYPENVTIFLYFNIYDQFLYALLTLYVSFDKYIIIFLGD